jgi:hypothetical protein
MSRAADHLRRKEKELFDSLVSKLQETAFDNRFFLHPRRFTELGTALADSFLHFLDAPDREAASAQGRKCAQEGLGEKTILALVSSLQHFSLEALGGDVQSLVEIDAFIWPLLEGYMRGREALILTEQEKLRRALSKAQESQRR